MSYRAVAMADGSREGLSLSDSACQIQWEAEKRPQLQGEEKANWKPPMIFGTSTNKTV